MAATTIQVHRRLPAVYQRRALVLALAAALAFTFAVVMALTSASTPATVDLDTTASLSDPTVAIGEWLEHDDEVFAGVDAAYLGECREDAPAGTTGFCSRLVDDLGATQVHIVGAHATDIGADVLLERMGDGGWRIAAVAPWPALGTGHDGAPWSPSTALAAWWSERAADFYGSEAIHLRSCGDATPHDPNAGPRQLCSTLVEDRGDVRVYDSGRADRPPDVRITVERNADHTWVVTETLAR